MLSISVCVATVRPDTVGATISSILRQTWTEWELIVVGQGDAGPLTGAVRAACDDDPRVRYIHAPNVGASAARNVGLSAAAGDIIAMTDDDCEARSDWLEVLAGLFDEHPQVGLVGGSLLPPPVASRGPSSCLALVPDEALYDPVPPCPRPPAGFNWVGANVAIRRAVAERIGRFDELLGPGAPFRSGEDVDYLHRLEAAGISMLSTPRAAVVHTYGRRHGLKPLVGYWRGQGTGQGAVLAKLALRQDPRGRADLRHLLRGYVTRAVARSRPGEGPVPGARRPSRLVSDAVRLPALRTSFRHCLRDFVVDEEGLLRPRR